MKMVIDELVTLLGLEIASGVLPKIQKFQGMLESVIRTTRNVSAALLAAASGAAYFAERTNQMSSKLAAMGQVSGLSTDVIQEMAVAAEMAGGSFDAMVSDLMSMQSAMNSPIPGEYNNALFMLGVNADKAAGKFKSADEIFMAVAEKLQGMSAQEQFQWASRVGISNESLLLINKGVATIEKLRAAAKDLPAVVDAKRLKDAQEFTIQLKTMQRILEYLGQNVAASAGPAMKSLSGDFTKWVSNNRDFIQLGLQYTIDGIVEGFGRFGKLLVTAKDKLVDFKNAIKEFLPEGNTFITWLEKSNVVADLVYGALIVLTGIITALGLKFMWVNKIIALVSLAIVDFLSYLRGGESVIGTIIEWLSKLGEKFDTVYDKFKTKGSQLKRWIDDISGFGPQGSNYNSKFDLSGILKPSVSALTSPIFPPVIGPRIPNRELTNQISIVQNISGDNAMVIAKEVRSGVLDLLSQTFPGGFTPVIN